MSHHHVKHVPGFGLDVAADRHVLPVGQHHGHLPLGRAGAALFGLRRTHRHRTPHVHMKNTPTYMYTWRCVHLVYMLQYEQTLRMRKSDRLESATTKSAFKCIEIDFQRYWIKKKPTTMDPGSSRTTCCSSDILTNSGPKAYKKKLKSKCEHSSHKM